MQLTTSLLPPSINSRSDSGPEDELAVVIDVLRATSVMAMALQAGARKIITCREIEQARGVAAERSPRPLLCGERGCQPIDGFDLGNSPAEYTPDQVGGRELILTTTNGTRAIDSVSQTRRVIAASFLNLSAALFEISKADRVHLVCAGTDGVVTAEDVLLAGAILSLCETRFGAVSLDDTSILARQMWRSWFPSADTPSARQLGARLRETRGGRNLIRVGYQSDLERCAEIDVVTAVPTRCSASPAAFAMQQSHDLVV